MPLTEREEFLLLSWYKLHDAVAELWRIFQVGYGGEIVIA